MDRYAKMTMAERDSATRMPSHKGRRHACSRCRSRDWVRAMSSPVLVLAVLHACMLPTCSHQGVNICAHDERPMTATAKRLSCKQDVMCIHETQCGCIPKGCTCGDSHCIYAAENHEDDSVGHTHNHNGEKHTHDGGDRPHHHSADGSIMYDTDSSALVAGAGDAAKPGDEGARKHHLVDDDSDGPMHTHPDGTEHGHPGGSMPHHHAKDGGLVFDMPKAVPTSNKARFVMNRGPLVNKHRSELPAHAESDAVDADAVHDDVPLHAAGSGETGDASDDKISPLAGGMKAGGGADSASGGSLGEPHVNGTLSNQTTSEMKQRMAGVLLLVLGMGITALLVAAFCACFGSAVVRCFKHKVLGKSMLSKDMFNDKEMMCMDWDSKSNAAGWRHDDGL